MNEPTHRVVGVRADSTESVLMTGMPLKTATEMQADSEVTGNYATTRIESDDKPPPVQPIKLHVSDEPGR
jgi:hypothetical protein